MMQERSRSLKNASDYAHSVIKMLDNASSMDVFCMNQVFPYILYPEDENTFLMLRSYETTVRSTLMGASELVSEYHQAFKRAYSRGVTFRYVVGLSSIKYYHTIIHGAFEKEANKQLDLIKERLNSVDIHIHVSVQTQPFCMFMCESQCLFAVIDHKNPGTVTTDRHVIDIYEKWFQNEYLQGIPITILWHLVESDNEFPGLESLNKQSLSADWYKRGGLPPIQTNLKKGTQLIPSILSDSFDVFLAHNSADKEQVEVISQELVKRGINPWLDNEQIPPGRFFQDEIQKAIGMARAAAIIIGPHGLGRWQVIELRSFISQCVDRNIPVIPVLLPSVKNMPDDLLFLNEFNFVKFTKGIGDSTAFDKLEWAITGENPKRHSKGNDVDE